MDDLGFKLAADALEVSIRQVREAYEVRHYYHLVEEPKDDGTMRKTWAPHPVLKEMQRRILHEFLYKILLGPDALFFFGFEPGRSWVDNARFHAGVDMPHVLRLDLKDAFPSITREHLAKVLETILLAEVRRIRTKLQPGEEFLNPLFPARHCSWFRKLLHEGSPDPAAPTAGAILAEFLELLLDLTTFRGRLVQGAPTSPRLLNLCLAHAEIIQRLRNVLTTCGVGIFAAFPVTVYADDFTISSPLRFDLPLIGKLIRAIEGAGPCFTVNRKKIRVFQRRQVAPLITGLRVRGREMVNGKPRPLVSFPKRKIRQLRGFFHSARGVPDLANKIRGHIACLKGINPRIPRQVKVAYDDYESSIPKKTEQQRVKIPV